MVPAARWLLVLAVAVVLVGAPVVVRAWPVEQSDVTAGELADAVRAADAIGWSGEVRSQGAVDIPQSDADLDGVARLLGEASDLRVWWRSGEEYRVDRVRPSGETDVVRDGGMTVRWRYEGNRVTFSPYSALRLPDDPDVLPVALARRMLAGISDDELSRLPEERIAGRASAGLRITPGDARSSIDRVDLWADVDTGLPLRVEVYAGEPAPVLASAVTDLNLTRPTARQTDLDIGPSADFSRGVSLDPEGGAATFEVFDPPAELSRLPRRQDAALGLVGVYGRGPTALAALPVRDRVADALRSELRQISTAQDGGRRQSVMFGPLSVALTRAGGEAYLLVGTVTPQTVALAADEIEARFGGRDGRR